MILGERFDENYWINKTNRKALINIENQDVGSLYLHINESPYFFKISKNNSLTQFTLLLSVYSWFLSKYFVEYDGTITTYNSLIENSSKNSALFFELKKQSNNESFKDYLRYTAIEVQTVLTHSNLPVSERQLDKYSHFGVSLNYFINPNCNGLFLDVKINGDSLDLVFIYKKDFVDKHVLNHFINNFRSFLSELEFNIELLNFKLIAKSEEELILKGFNDTHADYPRDKMIIDLFEEQVESTPDHIAVVFEDGSLTYRQLNGYANQLGAYLRKRYHILPNDLIGIKLDRSERMIISILGILKSGAAYVPIDPKYPEERISYLENDSRVKVIVDEPELEMFYAEREQHSSANLQRVNSPNDLVYVIYTSGTTGAPKGVMIEHTSLVNRLLWMQKAYPLTESDTLMQKTTYSFDVSVWELLWWAINGARVAIPKPGIERDPAALVEDIARNQVTVIHFVPSMLSVFLEYLRENLEKKDYVRSLKQVFVSGEALSIQQRDTFFEQLPDVALMNLYGPTEASIDVSFYDCSQRHRISSVPIGKPIDNINILILDEDLNLLPVGVAGKLYISGTGVARGYLNRPELTAEKFIDNPFAPGTRMYDTGDLARWLSDGNIEFLGRKDHQVKIRGYRIELGEIEAQLFQYSDQIKQVVAEVREINNEKSIVAYYVSGPGIDKMELRRFLQQKLPGYMVPGFFVKLKNIPLTSNGKVDRNALPAISPQDLIQREYIAPGNETELKLAGIWQEVLGLEKIGITDNFFELGGHSLMIGQVINRIYKQLSKNLIFKDFFANPTIERICQKLQNGDHTLPSVGSFPRPSRLPLSLSQERLWFIDQLEGSIQYHIPSVLRLTGKVDISALAYSLKSIVQRHEVLRTVLLEDEDGVYQEVRKGGSWELSVTEESDYGMLSSHISGFIGLPFDLSHDDMFRSELIRLESGDYLLVSVLHHIASDGWSLSLLVKELVELYNSSRAGRASSLASLPVQYGDYAVWQRGYLSGEFLHSDLSYWESKLSGIEPLNFPTDYSRPVVQSRSGKTLPFVIDTGLRDRLQDLGRQQGATLFMTLLSVFKVLLYRYTGQEDICVGTAIANRRDVQLEGLIGFFVNTLALRSSLDGEADFITFLDQVKETTLSAYDHQDVPFEMVVDKVVTNRDISRSPLFQVMFVLQNTPDMPELVLDEMRLSLEPYENKTSKFDLSFLLTESDEGISASIEYCTDLFREDTILRFWSHYVKLLEAVVLDPRVRLSELQLLSGEEEELLVHQFNDTARDYEGETVVELFERQARQNPFLAAIVYKGQNWSYQEVDEHSNRLGHYLIHIGVKGGDLVGICLERSAEMIIGILAVLKAGGAYVPIDAGYPKDRIQYMLEDTHAGYVLSDSRTKDQLPELSSYRIVMLDLEALPISEQISTAVPVQISRADLCYVMYTSGSTGRAKGVMIEHRNVVNFIAAVDFIDVSEPNILLSTGSPSFDAVTFEYWSMLLNGGLLILSEEKELLDIDLLKAMIIHHKVNIMWFSAGWFNQIVNLDKEVFAPLKTILIGGEKLSHTHVTEVQKKYGHIKIINGYGPTENTTFSLAHHIRSTGPENIPIGKPISNTQVYILDKKQGLVPQGVCAEIYLGGAGLGRGYLNNPELTLQKFIPNPFSTDPGSRLYRTGDLGRWTPEGEVEFMGRSDDQVKIRGYRIEPGEVEEVLQQSGLIDQAFVTVRTDEKRGKYLVVYLCGGHQNDQNSLISYLRSRLPEYMIPFNWVWLESFPLTSSGKIDRKALPPVSAGDSIHREYAGPGNETEQKLAEIWEELLGVEHVGIHDNFFELGGHSLLIIRLRERVNRSLDLKLPVLSFFEFPTISKLSEFLMKDDTDNNIKESDFKQIMEKSVNVMENTITLLNRR